MKDDPTRSKNEVKLNHYVDHWGVVGGIVKSEYIVKVTPLIIRIKKVDCRSQMFDLETCNKYFDLICGRSRSRQLLSRRALFLFNGQGKHFSQSSPHLFLHSLGVLGGARIYNITVYQCCRKRPASLPPCTNEALWHVSPVESKANIGNVPIKGLASPRDNQCWNSVWR